MATLDVIENRIAESLGDHIENTKRQYGELTIELNHDDVIAALKSLRNHPELRFEQLIDLCGVDYSAYSAEDENATYDGARFAVVYHLQSISLNHRLRVRTFLDDDFPVIPTATEIWSVADWFEREAFDLYGIMFEGHPDLRRILTDYGFIGHPFRKDFPLSGQVEMRYDPDKGRVIYQPVTIEPRVLVPRVIREEGFGDRNP